MSFRAEDHYSVEDAGNIAIGFLNEKYSLVVMSYDHMDLTVVNGKFFGQSGLSDIAIRNFIYIHRFDAFHPRMSDFDI